MLSNHRLHARAKRGDDGTNPRRTRGTRPSRADRRGRSWGQKENDTLQACHWAISLLKRWLLGTRAVREKHHQAYLDEFAFLYNRRKTAGVGRIAARVIEQLVARKPLTTRQLINETRPCRWFASDYGTAT